MFQTTLLTRRIINNTAKNCVMRSDCQCANESAYSEAEARKKQYAVILKTILGFFGGTAFIFNTILLVVLLRRKRKNKTDKLIIAFISGNALTGLGYVVSNSIKLARPCHLHYWSPMKCLVSSPQLSFYAIGIPLETFGMFLIALDRFLTIIMANTKWKFNDHRINRALFLTGTIVFGYAAALWVTACFRSNVLVTSCCFLEETAPKSYYLAYFGFVSALGYVGFCLFAIASVKYIFIKRKRMPIVQQQLRDIRQCQILS
ncbi:Polyribonucleotide nucleotidyltransferase [Trichinella spiralis]|uniref:Polyribonucleotide nucleotidyltransferase n=1 Tax=Trichinella spiralis TaxID=6334 RepID=A0ABR3K7Z6_TRISP